MIEYFRCSIDSNNHTKISTCRHTKKLVVVKRDNIAKYLIQYNIYCS